MSSLTEQMKRKVAKDGKLKRGGKKLEGDTTQMISTGSTLLDLAISGGRKRGGGIPGGILVEIFGPSGSGKTVLLCEIAGGVKRAGGEVMFKDPEARLNKQFARLFDLDVDAIDYAMPSTVPEVFGPIREWEPENDKVVNGVFADSLAALSTEMELDNNDKYGTRRSKEFSEELRKSCRTLTERNFLMVASNQVRQNLDAGPYAEKYKSPGGEALGFYSSLRLRMKGSSKIRQEETVAGKKVRRVIGVQTDVEVYKSSVWKPFGEAQLTILFDYGIDDVRENLQYVKTYKKLTTYAVGGEKLDQSMGKAIVIVEDEGLEKQLREEVIDLWEEIEAKFKSERKPKER